jgi:peroxiredoxin
VRLFAINLAEQTEDVKDFIEQSGLEIPVLMDPEGKIAEEYDAEAIPQTVLIDRQGVVRFVHVGLDPNLRQLLTEQLNTLVTESPGTSESTEAASR